MRKFTYIPQTNGYNCGPVAVMNAYNYHQDCFRKRHVPICETILHTCPIMGTEEKHMIKELRDTFTVKVERGKFSKRKIDNWIERSEDHQVIILYCYSPKAYEWHYANIFRKINGRYWGANFFTPSESGRWRFTKTIPEDYTRSFYRYQDDFVTLYIKPREVLSE